MKQLKHDERKALPSGAGSGANASALSPAERKARRLARKEINQQVEELKGRLFRISERHMDQVVRLIRRWLQDEEK